MNGNGIDKLAVARKERDRLQAALADVAARRERAGGPLAALTAAESAAASSALAAATARWLHGGGAGERPVREDFQNISTPAVLSARHAAAMALPVFEKLNTETVNISAQLSAARAAVLDAAARQKAADFEVLADRAKELREELADIEEELAAGYHHFVEQSDHDFAMTGKRNPALLLPQQAALAGFDEETATIRNVPMPDREMLARHREDFARLQEG